MRCLTAGSRAMTAPPSPVVMCLTGWKLNTTASLPVPPPIGVPRYVAPSA